MATLEDAAEELVVKLKGLDSEIEESQEELVELRERVETATHDVDEDFKELAEAAESFLEKVGELQEAAQRDAQEAVEAVARAGGAVHEDGALARSEIAQAQAGLEGLTTHAGGLEPAVESLVAEGVEEPARALAERAEEIQGELERVFESARDFFQDDVVNGMEQVAEDVRERCNALREMLAAELPSALRATFEDWEAQVDELEEYVASQGFVLSHAHAHEVVEWALSECEAACDAHLSTLESLVAGALRPLEALGEQVREAGASLGSLGRDLTGKLDGTLQSAASAQDALRRVADVLASYSFVQL